MKAFRVFPPPAHNFPVATVEEINTIVHTEVQKLSFDSNLGMPSISLTSLDKLKVTKFSETSIFIGIKIIPAGAHDTYYCF